MVRPEGVAGKRSQRVNGVHAENVERAIDHLRAVLTVHTRKDMPQDWAAALIALGGAFIERGKVDAAISAFKDACTVYTREAFPEKWGIVQYNLGAAYTARVTGRPADNIRQAIRYFGAALTVFRREDLPDRWAGVHCGLAEAYRRRTGNNHADDVERALAAYGAALTVRTCESFPREHLRTSRYVGTLLLEKGDWRAASAAYASARDAFLLIFGQGLDEVEAADLIDEAGPLFTEAAYARIEMGEVATAFQLAIEGRAHLLKTALRLQDIELSGERRQRLDSVRSEIRQSARLVQNLTGVERNALLERLTALRRELLSLIESTTAKNETNALPDARALCANGGAIVVPVITEVGAKLLVYSGATGDGELTAVPLPGVRASQVNKLVADFWILSLQMVTGSARVRDWLAAVDRLGSALWRLIGESLKTELERRAIGREARIIWLPTGPLGSMPIELAQDPTTRERLSDTYEIVHAPNLDALTAARQGPDAPSLAAVINPTGDLDFTELEARLVGAHFDGRAATMLRGSEATPEAVLAALRDKSYWHFASHAAFDWGNARDSALIMSDRAPLSVARLLDSEGLGKPRLVVLSACETGLYDIIHNPDEFVGLPSTFIMLGATGVLGTLWKVDDRATAFLIGRFYDLHLDGALGPPTALKRAQAWLRQATQQDLAAYAREAVAKSVGGDSELADKLVESLVRGEGNDRHFASLWGLSHNALGFFRPGHHRDHRPFAHPYYWGGFIYMGL